MIRVLVFCCLSLLPLGTLVAQPGWEVDPSRYAQSMNLVAVVYFDGQEASEELDMLAAFAGEECRGVGHPQYIEDIDRYLVFLQLYSNEPSNETLILSLYNSASGEVFPSVLELEFVKDDVLGQISEPLEIYDNVNTLAENQPLVSPFFSPNGDGINDYWVIGNLEDYSGFELSIFNEYGELLFQENDYQNDWDGTYKGRELPVGVYYFLWSKPGSAVRHTGSISLLR